MITIDIRPCEPHRAFHALLVVSGLRRPPMSARFTIMARHDGKSRYVGPGGWEDKFTECRELAAGWDAEQKVLWLLLGPTVIQPLDRGPFNFTLLQTGEQVTELAIPAPILLPGPDGLPPLAESHDKGVAAMLPLPLTTSVAGLRAAAPARTLFQENEAPVTSATAVEREGTPQSKDPSVKPVVVGIGLCLAAVLGVGFLLSEHRADPTPPVSAVTAPSLVASMQRQLPTPAATLHPVATPIAVAVPDVMPISDQEVEATLALPLPPLATLPTPVAVSTDTTATSDKVEDPDRVSSPRQADDSPATGSACGDLPVPGATPTIPETTSPEEAHCVALAWIASGRTDDAVAALSSLRRSGYVPAMLELAKLYDPLSKHSTPPPAPEFARDEYRRVIQRSGDNPTGQEARHRLNALQDG